MATLHFICGKAGSGKTTLARKLAAQHRAILLCEDEWLTYLDATIKNLADYVHHTKRLRAALAPHTTELLRHGISIVFDFAGNTAKDRAWVKSIFGMAGADHMLHVIAASDQLCKARIRLRNETKQAGIYFGTVTEAQFDEVTRHFVAPSPLEGFKLTTYEAAAASDPP